MLMSMNIFNHFLALGIGQWFIHRMVLLIVLAYVTGFEITLAFNRQFDQVGI